MRFTLVDAITLLMSLLSSNLFADSTIPRSSLSLYGSSNAAQLNGFFQVPAGGRPGTSSSQQPSFGELGITQSTFYQLGFDYDSTLLGIYGQYQHLRPKAHDTLDQNVTTHGIYLPAGSSVASDNKFDLYRLGFDHKFYYLNNDLDIYPEIELTGLHFAYNFTTPNVASTRSFHSMAERVGFGADYRLNSNVYFSGNVATSIPSLSNLQVQTANVDANVSVFKTKVVDTIVYAGVGYEKIHFTDKQALPNDISLIASPMAEVGLKFTF